MSLLIVVVVVVAVVVLTLLPLLMLLLAMSSRGRVVMIAPRGFVISWAPKPFELLLLSPFLLCGERSPIQTTIVVGLNFLVMVVAHISSRQRSSTQDVSQCQLSRCWLQACDSCTPARRRGLLLKWAKARATASGKWQDRGILGWE